MCGGALAARTIRLWSLCLGVAAAGCDRGPVELGFWFEPVSYASPRIGEPISAAEFVRIDGIARDEIRRAFAAYDVSVSGNRNARYRVGVLRTLKDERLVRGGTVAGQSRAMAGLGGSGAVNFEFVANGAMVFSPPSASREEVIDAVGRGIGRVAIHEFLHQLFPKAPVDGSPDPHSYEGNSAALVEGYFGELHWGILRPWLDKRLGTR